VKVYIAAPWVRKAEAISAGREFEAAGHLVTSRWFYHGDGGNAMDSTGITQPIEDIREQAWGDIEDVCGSDVLVVLNLEKSEGKAVETGIALMNNIPIVSVGTRSNIFQTLAIEVETVQEAIAALDRL
jgi:nucleoside 2-deoxyribosyltransferase